MDVDAKEPSTAQAPGGRESHWLDEDWPYLLTMLPSGWEQAATEQGALVRRRQVRDAGTLLRLALAYGVCGLSLRSTSGWAQQCGLVTLSNVAVLKRLRRADRWLAWLVEQKLAERVQAPAWTQAGLSVRLLDATCVSRPGSQGTDWRVHLTFDLGTWQIAGVQLSDSHGGESLERAAVQPGDVCVADRAYANRAGLWSLAKAGAYALVRMTWQNLPLEHPEGEEFDLLEHLRQLPPAQAGDWQVRTARDSQRDIPPVCGRVVAIRRSPEETEQVRKRVLQAAHKKGHEADARSLEAAGYLFLFTTLPAERFAPEQVLELYRFRWQVELAFKGMKSILDLDELSARDEHLCRTFLMAKLLATLLIEQLSRRCAAFPPWQSPWGYGRPAGAAR